MAIIIKKDGTVEPFNLKLLRQTKWNLMAPTRDRTEEADEYDGEIDFGAEFQSQSLELHCITEEGLSIEEKHQKKVEIADTLNNLRDGDWLMVEHVPDKKIFAHFAGRVQIEEYPSWLRVTVPLRLDPFWVSAEENEFTGNSGTIENAGTFETPVIVEILAESGNVENPSITIGEEEIKYNGTIDKEGLLKIDAEKMTAALDGRFSLNYTESGEDFATGVLDGVVAGEDGLELGQSINTEQIGPTTPSGNYNTFPWGHIISVSKSVTITTAKISAQEAGNITVELRKGWVEDIVGGTLIDSKVIAVSSGVNEIELGFYLEASDDLYFLGFSEEHIGLYRATGISFPVCSADGKVCVIGGGHYTSGNFTDNWYYFFDLGLEFTHYAPSGSRISPPLDLSGAGTVKTSEISWQATEPTDTSLKVETSLSTDSGETWGAWQQATNGGSIPGITANMDLSTAKLKTRATLATTDTSVTPLLTYLRAKTTSANIWENVNALANYEGSFPKLPPGETDVSVTAESGNPTVTLRWHDRWV